MSTSEIYKDYHPGGSPMPGRNFNSNSYRYGYNKGSEKDDEISGAGNHFTTFYREGDTRLLTWWSVDPEADEMPWQSPYSYMDGNPIQFNDPDGDWIGALIDYGFQVGGNLMQGKSGYDAFVGDVNWVSVAVSAIPGGGLVATVAKEAVKATVKVSVNEGVNVKTDVGEIVKETAKGVAIDRFAKAATTKIKVGSSDEALKKAEKNASSSNLALKKAENAVVKKPNSTKAATNLDKAKSASQEARKTQVRTQMANATVNNVPDKLLKKTISTTTKQIVKSNETTEQKK